MIECFLFYGIIYIASSLFFILTALLDRDKVLNLSQNLLLSGVFLFYSAAAILKMMNIEVFDVSVPAAILFFLASVVANFKVFDYLRTKKVISNTDVDFVGKMKVSSVVFPLVLVVVFGVVLTTRGVDRVSVGILGILGILTSFGVILALKLKKEIADLKFLEELAVSVPLAFSLVLVTLYEGVVFGAILPLSLTPLVYNGVLLVSPFAINQELRAKVLSFFPSVLMVLPSVYILIVSVVSSYLVLIPAVSVFLVFSVLLSVFFYKLMLIRVKSWVLRFVKPYVAGASEEDITSLTIGNLISRIYVSVEKFLGKNVIEVFAFNAVEKSLNLLFLIDGKTGFVDDQKRVELSDEELSAIMSRSYKVFMRKSGELLGVFDKLGGDVLIPITYGYELKFVVSIVVSDEFESNYSAMVFFSEVFHSLLLETQSIITKNLPKATKHNVLLFIKDVNIRQELTISLMMENYEVFSVTTFGEAQRLVEKMNIDLLICDNEVDNKSGINLVRHTKSDPLKGNVFCVIGFYQLDDSSSKEFLESFADLSIFLKDDFLYINDTISFITRTLMSRKKVETTFKNITALGSYSTVMLNKILGYKLMSFEEIEFDTLSKVFLNPSVNAPSFLIIGRINNTFIQSRVFAIFQEGQVVFIDKVNVPLNFYSRKRFGKNRTLWSDYISEGLPPSEFSKSFAKELTDLVTTIYNFLAISIEDTVAIGLNFQLNISPWDVDFMKSFLVNYLLIRAVYDEVREVDNAFIYTMQSLARAAEEMDEETGIHIYRVGEYSKLVSQVLGLSGEFSDSIYYASQMHDIGKLKIPREILRKPGPLTPEEFEIIKEHTIAGAMILGDHPKLDMARDIALSHHEKWDGSGYPYGIEKDRIPISARIVALADVYDALRSPRRYKPKFEHERVVKIITVGDGRTEPNHFDPDILAVFKEIHDKFNEIFEKYEEG